MVIHNVYVRFVSWHILKLRLANQSQSLTYFFLPSFSLVLFRSLSLSSYNINQNRFWPNWNVTRYSCFIKTLSQQHNFSRVFPSSAAYLRCPKCAVSSLREKREKHSRKIVYWSQCQFKFDCVGGEYISFQAPINNNLIGCLPFFSSNSFFWRDRKKLCIASIFSGSTFSMRMETIVRLYSPFCSIAGLNLVEKKYSDGRQNWTIEL